MKDSSNSSYIKMIFIHLCLGGIIFVVPFLSKILSIVLFFLFSIIIIKKKNKSNEALLFAAYIMASEVFFRMTNGVPNNESKTLSLVLKLKESIVNKYAQQVVIEHYINFLN